MNAPVFDRPYLEAGIVESDFRAFFELAGVGITQVDVVMRRFLRVNQYFANLVGYSPDELRELSFLDLTHPDDIAENIALFDRLVAGEIPTLSLEKRLRRKDGGWVWIIATASLVRDSDGRPMRTVAVIQDITERKRREVQAALIAEVQDAFSCSQDVAEIMRVVGAALCRALGASRVGFVALDDEGDAVSLHTHDTAFPSLADKAWSPDEFLCDAILAELHKGDSVAVEDVRVDPRTAIGKVSGSLHTGVAVLHVPPPSCGRCRFVVIAQHLQRHVWRKSEIDLVRDVATRVWVLLERNEAAVALRESEARLRRAMEVETVGIVFFHLAGTIVDANDAFLRLTGYEREELRLGLVRWDRVIPLEWMPVTNQAMSELTRHGRTTPYEIEYQRKDGARRSALSSATLLTEDEGVQFIIDITERRKAEALLSRDREQLEQYVLQRTAELDAVNGALRDEILERKQGELER